MMRRLLGFSILVALVVAAAVWLADRPGTVTIHWQGWRVDSSVPVLLTAIALLVLLMEGSLRLLHALAAAPGRFLGARRARRTRQGYLALSDGLAAVAAGDTRTARKLARQADRLLADSALTGLLTAQAATLSGDRDEARRRFESMTSRPETAFIGLKGLMDLALADQDHDAALDYGRRAWALHPGTAGLAAALFDLQARAGLWAEAEALLGEARRHDALGTDEIKRRQAIAQTARSAAAEAEGRFDEAESLALKAHQSDGALTAAAVRAARLLKRRGRDRKALAVLETAFKTAPHPDLAEALRGLAPAEPPLETVKRMERLVKQCPDAAESHVALGQAALAAKLWGQARTHLEKAAALTPSRRVFRLLAQVERDEGKGEIVASAWEAKAAATPSDPHWQCGACGAPAAAWDAVCPACGAVGRLDWTI